jgi:ABC-2 type transport system ATP-binding protein
MMAIQLDQIAKSFSSFNLGPIDLSLETGYIHAIIGSNGAGKSTLFRIILGQITPDQGKVTVLGLNHPQQEKEIREQIGYVPSEYLGPERWNARKLAKFYRLWYPHWDQKKFEALINKFEVNKTISYQKLSAGNRRKLLFSLAVSCQTPLLLLDEPTNGYDFKSRQTFYDELTQFMQSNGRTVVIATHSTEEINKIADFITLIDQGQIIGTFEKDSLTEQWKKIWLKSPTDNGNKLPAVVRIDKQQPNLLITSNVQETTAALQANGDAILQIHSMSIEEIVMEITEQHRSHRTSLDEVK